MKLIKLLLITLSICVILFSACATPSAPTERPAPTPTGSETVTFPDGNLEAVVRDALGKPPGEEIIAAELAKLTMLKLSTSPVWNTAST